VIERYKGSFNLGLTEQEKFELIQYLKSLSAARRHDNSVRAEIASGARDSRRRTAVCCSRFESRIQWREDPL